MSLTGDWNSLQTYLTLTPMTTLPLKINERLCYSCGKNTRNPIYCCKCYNKTPAGRLELKREVMMRKYARLDGGASCRNCVHWENKCLLGIPEAGSVYAEDCPARESISVLE